MTLEQPNPSHVLLAIAVTISLYVSSSLTLFDMAAASVQKLCLTKTHISFVHCFTTNIEQPVILTIIVDPLLVRHNKLINNKRRYTKHKDLLLIYLTIIGLSFIGFPVWYFGYNLDDLLKQYF
jgi:hypothetical protein